MLPFASALAIAALGQTLVVMQGGIDLSVAGGLSLYVVILTHYPNGDNSRLLPAIGIAFLAAIGAGSLNGFLIGRMRLNPIVATLGTNALLYGAVLWYTGGIPRTTTARLARLGGGLWLGIPIPVYFAVVATAVVTAVVKLTPAGRRFEGVGANGTAARTAGIRVKRHRTGAYVWAQLLYCLAAVLHAGIVNQPTAYEGDNYLLPVRRSGRARGHVAARRPRQPRRDRGRRSLPVAARPVRARARRDVRHRASSSRRLRSRWASRSTPSTGERSRDASRGVGRRASRPPDTVAFSARRVKFIREEREDTYDDPEETWSASCICAHHAAWSCSSAATSSAKTRRRCRRGVARRRSRSV